MTTLTPRQPFAALDSPRLQTLASTKNRQNSIPASFSPAAKPVLSSPQKRRHSPSSFDDDFDGENVDPSRLTSPTKRSKAFDGSPQKASKFVLSTTPSLSSSLSSTSSRFSTPISPLSQQSKPRSVPVKSPISNSRGSPKHKRVGILSKRRTSSSPFTRVDPPSFGRSPRRSTGLPFSIDAALSGTIPTYTPTAKAEPAKPANVPTLDEAMPKGWFFEIHEDTAEQEATNLMEHSACTLDISSDDDCDTKARNEADERGKENIPPPDYHLANPTTSSSTASDSEDTTTAGTAEITKASRPRHKYDVDAMHEDRSPLGDLRASDYFGEGLNASSHVIVDGEKASALSKDCTADFVAAPSDDAENAPDAGGEPATEKNEVDFGKDERKEIVVYDDGEVS
ncbi:hypothetical protein K490DRAFT_41530 [Saccharata proteae CBS 121410]|uniref:Thymidylate kinase protein n=1 Tax=Saccharata proteae CBS 121410 TaxID=1314787 RepID=A0A9P4HVM2_9PEZI|nr:hypothetical protein K490DRAFT_41530 [Saccharata proteae CBS 121410]